MAGRYDITIEQGATFDLPVTYTNSDGTPFVLTDYTLRGQIRRHIKSDDIVASFTFDMAGEAIGHFHAQLTAAITAGIEAGETVADPRSKYVYDIEAEHDSTHEVRRILEGNVSVSPEVTRP